MLQFIFSLFICVISLYISVRLWCSVLSDIRYLIQKHNDKKEDDYIEK